MSIDKSFFSLPEAGVFGKAVTSSAELDSSVGSDEKFSVELAFSNSF